MPTLPDNHKPIKRRHRQHRRSSAHQSLYNRRRWRKNRLTFLQKNPLCVHCLAHDIIEPATEIDHIIPHQGNESAFWDESNYQALCKPCHSRKTLGEALNDE